MAWCIPTVNDAAATTVLKSEIICLNLPKGICTETWKTISLNLQYLEPDKTTKPEHCTYLTRPMLKDELLPKKVRGKAEAPTTQDVASCIGSAAYLLNLQKAGELVDVPKKVSRSSGYPVGVQHLLK